MSVPDRPPNGRFHTFQMWVDKAPSWIGGKNALCVDAADRVCQEGQDFMRARDENKFPVRFWYGEGQQPECDEPEPDSLFEAKVRRMWGLRAWR